MTIKLLRAVSFFLALSLGLAACEARASFVALEDRARAHIGEPYVASPLTQDAPHGFDCTTYVETVLSEGYADVYAALNLIRYRDGEIGFFTRNHFMENMWIPNALRHGFIEEIVLADVDKSSIDIDLAEWYLANPETKDKNTAYIGQARKQERFTAHVSYLPVSRINNISPGRLPAQAVVFFLRRYPAPRYSWLRNDNAVMITHMGLLFGGARLYHASSARRAVAVEDFLAYLRTNRGVYGVAFYRVTR
ncbi:hypothetical protein AGMMS50276_08590 [Synergistales bacterium]|nr:hypothetical protein AGMMS50276_08590 [Synergistales bacterium]